MANFKDVAVAAAKEAGAALLVISKGNIAYKMKNEHDIQAEADLEAERIILGKIRQNFPEHGILSEEAGDDEKNTEYRWAVDPIDGTINFSRHIEEYCVSIGLSQNEQPILGVIYQPASDKLYLAEKGHGVYLNGERIRVSDTNQLIDCLGATDMISSDMLDRERNLKLLAEISPLSRHIRIFGSGALHMARLAQGQLDFYFKMRYHHWDYAAGTLLVQEAGGIVTDAKGQPITRNSRDIVAAPPAIHPLLLQLTSKY